MSEDDAKWLTVKDAAARAKLSPWSIYQGCERGEIRHIRVGGRRAIRITPEALDDWLRQHERGPAASSSAPDAGWRERTMAGSYQEVRG